MTSRSRQNLLLFYAAGVLDADGQAVARQLLQSDDPQVQAEWAHARSVTAHLALAAPAAKAPEGARVALRERVRDKMGQAQTSPVAGDGSVLATVGRRESKPRWWPAVASALAAAAAAALVVWVLLDLELSNQAARLQAARTAVAEKQQQLDGLRERLAIAEGELQAVRNEASRSVAQLNQRLETLRVELGDMQDEGAAAAESLAARERQLGELRERLADAEGLLQTLRSEASARVTLAGADPQPDATGTLVYDPQTRGVIMLARGFKPAAPGETYQLWLVTDDGRKVSVGTFNVAANGQATLTTTLDADPGTAVVTAVTNEPVGGSDQPTGQFQMLGEF